MDVCTYIETNKTLYEYVNVSVYVYTNVQAYVYVSVHVHVYVLVYLYMYVNMCMCRYMRTVVYRGRALGAATVVWPGRCPVATLHSASVLGYITCMQVYRYTCLSTYTYSCTCAYMLSLCVRLPHNRKPVEPTPECPVGA